MNAMQHETSLKLVSFPLKICWSFLETPFNLHWNSLERPLKLPWNTDWLPLNPFDILWCCTTFQMNYRPFELLWNTLKNASKHTSIFLETPMKLSWKTFKTSLKHPWNTLETFSKHHLTHRILLTLFDTLWHSKCISDSKGTKGNKGDVSTNTRRHGLSDNITSWAVHRS